MSKITEIDKRLGKAFIHGENLEISGGYSVQSYDNSAQIYVGYTPIMWFNKSGGFLRFTMNKQNTRIVRNRLNGVLRLLYGVNIFEHLWEIITKNKYTFLMEDEKIYAPPLANDTIMTVLPVCMNMLNRNTQLIRSSPAEAEKMNIENGVLIVEKPKIIQEDTTTVTFADLSGVC